MTEVLPDTRTALEAFYLKEHEQVATLQWKFYAFNVTERDYQIVINVAGEETPECTNPLLGGG